jgi:membrane-associated protein
MLIGCAFFSITILYPDWLSALIQYIQGSVASLGYWVLCIVFLIACIESFPFLGVLLPSLPILLLVGWSFAAQSIHHAILAWICWALGAIFGNSVGYFLWKWRWDLWLKEYGLIFGIGAIEQEWMRKHFQGHIAGITIFLGKFHGLTRSFVPFMAGISWVSGHMFWIYNSLGSIVWSVTILSLGIFFSQSYKQILDNIGWIFTWGALLVFGYFFLFQRKKLQAYFAKKMKEIDDFYK